MSLLRPIRLALDAASPYLTLLSAARNISKFTNGASHCFKSVTMTLQAATWSGSRRLLWWLGKTITTVAPPVDNTTTSSAKTTTTSVATTVRPTAARALLVTLSSTPRLLKPKRPHYQKPTTQVIPKKFGERPSFGRILGENFEVSGDGDGAGKEDGLEAEAGSGEDKTEFLFQPEWPEVTYFTTDLKQAELRSSITDQISQQMAVVTRLNASRDSLPVGLKHAEKRHELRRTSGGVNMIHYRVLLKVARIKRLWMKVNRSHAALAAANSNVASTRQRGTDKPVVIDKKQAGINNRYSEGGPHSYGDNDGNDDVVTVIGGYDDEDDNDCFKAAATTLQKYVTLEQSLREKAGSSQEHAKRCRRGLDEIRERLHAQTKTFQLVQAMYRYKLHLNCYMGSIKTGLHERLIAQLFGRHGVARFLGARIGRVNTLARPISEPNAEISEDHAYRLYHNQPWGSGEDDSLSIEVKTAYNKGLIIRLRGLAETPNKVELVVSDGRPTLHWHGVRTVYTKILPPTISDSRRYSLQLARTGLKVRFSVVCVSDDVKRTMSSHVTLASPADLIKSPLIVEFGERHNTV
ncbi:hypothetical protein LSAT2_015915 [Lamellibrachia satsuma]|nr:hypothetical protein LSAT2_015915 [Lamellibrachia satsuma]